MSNVIIEWVLVGYAGVHVTFEDEELAREAHAKELNFAPRAALYKRTVTSEKVAGI